MRHNGYAELFLALDARWGTHSIHRFAMADDCQPLQVPHTGRFCSHCPDAFMIPWRAKTVGPA